MRFDDAAARLAGISSAEVLPAGPDVLMPQFLDGRVRSLLDVPDSARPAAVLVLVFPDEGSLARLVLTARVTYDGYRVDGLHVWGATARILGQLGAVLGGAPADSTLQMGA